MRQSYLLKISLIGALFLTACAEAPQNGSDVPLASAAPETVSKAAPDAKPTAPIETETEALSDLDPYYQGLDPTIISRAEINEHIALTEEKYELGELYVDALRAWSEEDHLTRGEEPQDILSPRQIEIKIRLSVLNEKLHEAQSRKRYTALDPSIISKSEIDALVAYEQKQEELQAEKFKAIQDWNTQDPATRGEKPEFSYTDTLGDDPDMLALQLKVYQAEESDRFSTRIQTLSKAHNIPLLDSDLAEIAALNVEISQFQTEMMLAMTKAATKSEAAGEEFSDDVFLNAMPRERLRKMFKVQERLDELTYPFDAAENADEVRNQLKYLSEESGVRISPREIEEAVDLHAETNKILKRVEFEGIAKQLDSEDLSLMSFEPQAEGADKERLEEIEARLIEISEPMEAAIREQLKDQSEQ